MLRLEDITTGARLKGAIAGSIVAIRDARMLGADALEVVCEDEQGAIRSLMLFRSHEHALSLVEAGRRWSLDADGSLLRLVAEARRIQLAHLFDPRLAVNTSMVDPLPHQITAVYDSMLQRQPLRFLLADDPGAGKTIMAGLLIKELRIRGDVQRCMIVCPGNLAEQWQDELLQRFGLRFDILTNDKLQAHNAGNWFAQNDLIICRLDKLSRNEDVQALLAATDWDLIVCDEAHKMSANYFGGEPKYTKRYRLGQQLSRITRHLLLLTATPHNGKDDDFQLFLALLDPDRFEGRSREAAPAANANDLMRRLVKERLLKFDGRPLFPERFANTVNYDLSSMEAYLYTEVTEYVKNEFNRADRLDDKRKGTVGFALTSLQRRLASSPEAIYQSLARRKARLEKRLREEQLLKRGGSDALQAAPRLLDADDWDELEEAAAEEEGSEEQITDQATAAQSIAELQIEIDTLARLEQLADGVRASGLDCKWDQLSRLLSETPEMVSATGARHKLVIFTEFVDTLRYLERRIRNLIGRDEAVVVIHGAVNRDDRRRIQEQFTQDKDVQVLIATDAAGEGINLQRAHLMVNYDLPWNPNRLEQRFGRIHRIGQTEVCYLWNLVAAETREGDVFNLLLKKLEAEREALSGGVFDVLGKVFQGTELRQLLISAIRYGDSPEARAKLHEAVDNALEHDRLVELIEDRALTTDTMDLSRVLQIREEMERAQARRLQPHYIEAFFRQAFEGLGGTLREREPRRFEITHVPQTIRSFDQTAGKGTPLLRGYERITFEKDLITVEGRPLATFVCPGHPLLDNVIQFTLLQHARLLRDGAILVNDADLSTELRALYFLEQSISDGRRNRDGSIRTISRQLHFVLIDQHGNVSDGGPAPYLDFRPATDAEREAIAPQLSADWLGQQLEQTALGYAASNLIPRHLEEVQLRTLALVEKTEKAVAMRLTAEIQYWDTRANVLKEQEEAGRQPRMNWQRARERADGLAVRLAARMEELKLQKGITASPPQVTGAVLVVPAGLLRQLKGETPGAFTADKAARDAIEQAAMEAVMATEFGLGHKPRDVSRENCGYDIESTDAATGHLRFIEVKGRAAGADTVTVTCNEILSALNSPERHILALVEVDGGKAKEPVYVRGFFTQAPRDLVVSENIHLAKLLTQGGIPS